MKTFHTRSSSPLVRRILIAAALLLVGLALVLTNRKANVESFTAGYARSGAAVTAHLVGSGDTVGLFLIASIHGSEGAGTPLAGDFQKWLLHHPNALDGQRVLILPVANPDGLADNKRLNRHGVDLNRNFPADNRIDQPRFGPGPLSEPESRAIFNLIDRFQPAAVISIHQPLACIDYDGPAADLAETMAANCPLPIKKLGSRPGSLGAYFGETLNRPIITLELPKNPPPNLWPTYAPALKAALQHIHSSDTPSP